MYMLKHKQEWEERNQRGKRNSIWGVQEVIQGFVAYELGLEG